MSNEKKIVGYRLLEKDEKIKEGDVAGWRRKQLIDMNNWEGDLAGSFNQPVFRPLSSFEDMNRD